MGNKDSIARQLINARYIIKLNKQCIENQRKQIIGLQKRNRFLESLEDDIFDDDILDEPKIRRVGFNLEEIMKKYREDSN